jgi:hypothetical protein
VCHPGRARHGSGHPRAGARTELAPPAVESPTILNTRSSCGLRLVP